MKATLNSHAKVFMTLVCSQSNIQTSMSIRDWRSLNDTPSGEEKSILTSQVKLALQILLRTWRVNTVFFLLKENHSGGRGVGGSGLGWVLWKGQPLHSYHRGSCTVFNLFLEHLTFFAFIHAHVIIVHVKVVVVSYDLVQRTNKI